MINLQHEGGKYCAENILEMKKLYDNGLTLSKIAKIFKTTPDVISRKLKENGVEVTASKYYNDGLVKNYFENINSLDRAYFLGFTIADGNVAYGHYMRYRISLKENDEYILKTMNKYIGSSNELKHKTVCHVKEGYNDSKMTELAICCKEFIMHLAKYGVVPNKTFDTFLPILDKSMMPHLIRGIIDGDGWISANNRSVGVIGSVRLVNDLRNFLTETLGVHYPKITQESRHDDRIGKITWNKISDVEKICNYIYQGKSDCYLVRKYENWMKLKKYYDNRPFRIPASEIRVRQYDIDGNFIREYKNNTEAEKVLNIHHGSILANCKKRYKSAGGFIFKFNPEDFDEYCCKGGVPMVSA